MLSAEELDTQERSKYMKIVVAAFIAGAIIFMAQEVMEWMLVVDFDKPDESTNVPPIVVSFLGKIIGFARFIGGGLIVLGIIVAVIKPNLENFGGDAQSTNQGKDSHRPECNTVVKPFI